MDKFKAIGEEFKKLHGDSDPDFFKEKYFDLFYRFRTKQEHVKRVNEKVEVFLKRQSKGLYLSDFLQGTPFSSQKRYKSEIEPVKERFGLSWQFDRATDNLKRQNSLFTMKLMEDD